MYISYQNLLYLPQDSCIFVGREVSRGDATSLYAKLIDFHTEGHLEIQGCFQIDSYKIDYISCYWWTQGKAPSLATTKKLSKKNN